MLIQLPNDAIAHSYRKQGFSYQQVFESKKLGFVGTEKEFMEAGHGYEYIQIDQHTRLEIKQVIK